MSIVASLGAAATSLGALGASIGAAEGLEKLKEWKLSKHPDIYGLQGVVNAIMQTAAAKGSTLLEKINRKLEEIVAPFGMSSEVQAYYQKARRKLTDLRDEVTELNKKVDIRSASLAGDTQTHEMLSAGGKMGALGESLRDSIKQDKERLERATAQYDKIEQKLIN